MMERRKFLGLAAGTAGIVGLSHAASAKRPAPPTVDHPYVYAADFYNGSWDDAIEAAIDEAWASKKGTVELPGGRLPMTRPVSIPPAVVLRGRGSQLFPNPGTTLDFATMPSGNAVTFGADGGGFNHSAGLERLQIRSAPEHAVYVDVKIGEDFILDYVRVIKAGGDGFHFTKATSGSTPVDLGHLAAFGCDRGLFMMRTFQRTSVQIRYISGDNNFSSLMMFRSGDVSGSLKVGAWKCEIRGTSQQPTAIEIVDGNGALITIGQGSVFSPRGKAPTGEAIVKSERIFGGHPKLTLEGIVLVDGAKDYFATGLRRTGFPDIPVADITRRYWSNKTHELLQSITA